MTGPTEKSQKTNLETINNIKSCRPVQYEQNISLNSRKWPRKAFFTRIDRVNTQNEAENI